MSSADERKKRSETGTREHQQGLTDLCGENEDGPKKSERQNTHIHAAKDS